MTADRPIILILGPTAGGKTGLAIDLANRLPGSGECLSADSMQVYRGMDIGTAKPTREEQHQAPHHLINLVDPSDEGFTVDTWLDHADRVIAELRAQNKWPIVVGGTNLYIQALLFGLIHGPQPDPELRQRLQGMSDTARRAWLERIDSDAAARIHPNDTKRTIRAIEVHEQTGEALSALQTQWEQPQPRDDVFIIGLEYDVDAINRRINTRVKAMIDRGLVEEVQSLHEAGRLGRQAREALGYKQIIDHLEGRSTLDEAVEQIKIRTRRFAKQQRTWLRRFRTYQPGIWLRADEISPETLADKAFTSITTACDPSAAE